MLTIVGPLRRGQPLSRNSLPSSLKKPRELPVKKHRLENSQRIAPALVSLVKVEEGWDRVRVRRVQRGLARTKAHGGSGKSGKLALPLWRVVLPRTGSGH